MEQISFYYLPYTSVLSRVLDMIAEKRWEEAQREDWDGPWHKAEEKIYLLRVAMFGESTNADSEMGALIEQSDESELTLVTSERDCCYYLFAGTPDEVLEEVFRLAPNDLRLRMLVE